MPLYGYQCDTCGHQFEVRQGIREDALTECPRCGSPIRRIIYPVGIVFKGSGFYVNDSRNASSTAKPAGAGDGTNGDKTDKGDKKNAGSAEPAASGDKATAGAAPAGDGAKSTSTGASANSGSAPASGSNTSSS